MRYGDAIAFRQALEELLKTGAEGDPSRLPRDRKRVAFDRLLARLVAVAPGRWLLKGGFALDLRLAERARATKDVDIEWREGAGDLIESLIEATEFDPGDFFVFAIERTETPEGQFGGSHRFRVSASVASRSFETFLLDVGFRRAEVLATETLVTPDLLGFAGIPPVEVEAVPVERQVAEKLHAYTRTYEGGRVSTRAKDLIDLLLIADMATLDADSLRQAIHTSFVERDTHPVTGELPAPPAEWAPQFRRLAKAVGVPGDLETGRRLAASLLEPILNGEVTSGTWNPKNRSWVTRRN